MKIGTPLGRNVSSYPNFVYEKVIYFVISFLKIRSLA